MPDEFLALEMLVYGTIRYSSLYVETEFLSLAQAIESFHRLTDQSSIGTKQEFRTICKTLGKELNKISSNEKLKKRMHESVAHAYEPNFRTRIEVLLEKLGKDNCRRLLGDLVEFERKLRKTRNYFTHPGIQKSKDVLT